MGKYDDYRKRVDGILTLAIKSAVKEAENHGKRSAAILMQFPESQDLSFALAKLSEEGVLSAEGNFCYQGRAGLQAGEQFQIKSKKYRRCSNEGRASEG